MWPCNPDLDKFPHTTTRIQKNKPSAQFCYTRTHFQTLRCQGQIFHVSWKFPCSLFTVTSLHYGTSDITRKLSRRTLWLESLRPRVIFIDIKLCGEVKILVLIARHMVATPEMYPCFVNGTYFPVQYEIVACRLLTLISGNTATWLPSETRTWTLNIQDTAQIQDWAIILRVILQQARHMSGGKQEHH